MLCYCNSLDAAGSCAFSPLALICRLLSFYGLEEAHGRPFMELFFLFSFCRFFKHRCWCQLVTIIVFRDRLNNQHVKKQEPAKSSVPSVRGVQSGNAGKNYNDRSFLTKCVA